MKIFKQGHLLFKCLGKHRFYYFDQLSGNTNLNDDVNWFYAPYFNKYVYNTYGLSLADYKALCEFGNLDKTFICNCCGKKKLYTEFFSQIRLDWKPNCYTCCKTNRSKIRSNTFSKTWRDNHEEMSNNISKNNFNREKDPIFRENRSKRIRNQYVKGNGILYYTDFGSYGNLSKQEQLQYFKIGVSINPEIRLTRSGYDESTFTKCLSGNIKYLRKIESLIKKEYSIHIANTYEAFKKELKEEILQFILKLAKKYKTIKILI